MKYLTIILVPLLLFVTVHAGWINKGNPIELTITDDPGPGDTTRVTRADTSAAFNIGHVEKVWVAWEVDQGTTFLGDDSIHIQIRTTYKNGGTMRSVADNLIKIALSAAGDTVSLAPIVLDGDSLWDWIDVVGSKHYTIDSAVAESISTAGFEYDVGVDVYLFAE